MEKRDAPPALPATLPVTREVQRAILERIGQALPEGVSAMLIGGSLMLQRGMHPTGQTKDTDVVLVIRRDGGFGIPQVAEVAGVLEKVATGVTVRKDRTSVAGIVEVEDGRYLVELIRGRGAQGGYFVRRTLLTAVAARSERQGKLLIPPLEALAVLKAWAATDQDKLVEAGRDREGTHAARASDFRRDVRLCLEHLLRAGAEPDVALVGSLLHACQGDRRSRMRDVLVEQGWPL